MDGPAADSITGFIVAGLIIAVLGIWSTRFYLRKYRLVAGDRGKFEVEFFGTKDLIVSLIIVGWFLLFTLPVYFTDSEVARDAINVEAIVISMMIYLLLVIMLTAYLLMRGVNLTRLFGLDGMGLGKLLLAAAGFLLAAYPLLALAAGAGQVMVGEQTQAQGIVEFFLSSNDSGTRFLVIILAVLVAPVTEEFIFRGYVYGSLKARFGMWPAMLMSGAVFALVHVHLPSLGVFLLLSICLVIAYEWSGNLLLPMAMHALFNSVSVAMLILLPGDLL